MVEFGFDLTGFGSADIFSGLLKRHGLVKYRKVSQDGYYNTFEWSNPHLKIVTGNNPLTGEYSGGDMQRGREKGYASYIGIEGDADRVMALVRDIKRVTKDIKGENPNEREFI